MSLSDSEKVPQAEEKQPYVEENENQSEKQQIDEKQASEEKDFNEKSAAPNETPLNTVENVVKQQNLGVKPSPQQDLPFDFNRFLEQMKHRRADKINRILKNFQREFERKPFTINEQIRIVHDFLDFIPIEMRECEIWRDVSEQEFENAKEGIEKLVMNRLYSLTFTPAIKGPVTTDDRERDEILHQKIQIFRWVKEEHLDIPLTQHNESFLGLAQEELLKLNAYKAPRDKLICILNCCKVIFRLIRKVDGEEGADKFLPILIYVVLRANPEHLVSNVQYISRFRNPEKLQSEAGYYLSSLMGAIAFIENMDVSSLSITQEDFDKNIEITMKELESERPKPEANDSIISYDNVIPPSKSALPARSPIIYPAQARALYENGKNFAQRTIQMPLNMFGKIIADVTNEIEAGVRTIGSTLEVRSSSQSSSPSTSPHRPPLINEPPPLPPRSSSLYGIGGIGKIENSSSLQSQSSPRERSLSVSSHSSRTSDNSNEYSEMQEELARVSAATYESSLKTLKQIFQNVDAEVREAVLQASDGELARAIDKILEMFDFGSNNKEGDGVKERGDDDIADQLPVDSEGGGGGGEQPPNNSELSVAS
ncbi:2091_t:CDS:2 [Ambispora leptoticha]|uniref:2091_t:CDS:1 n=1 Tax=Ambispora leptoticha TaxID=144679 RepID=A0A9N8V9C8_9GLOM|nr:2091_t:CDS:2 [Ambispora leptoticha]